MTGNNLTTIKELAIEAPGYVPWWPRPDVKLFNIMVHLLALATGMTRAAGGTSRKDRAGRQSGGSDEGMTNFGGVCTNNGPMPSEAKDLGPFYHGTKADLRPRDLLEPGYSSNFGERTKAKYIYLTGTLDAATWGAELAVGEGPGRIYQVEPTGPFEDDPNLTDKRFPGNPTRSYRTREPLRVVDEVVDWEPHSPEVLQDMRDHLEELKRLGIEAIND